MRILLFILGFIFLSFWLTIIIEVGVSAGIKSFYKMNFQKKEENEMKVFEFAGVIFNADNVCTVQKVTLKEEATNKKEIPPKIPGFQIVTIAGGMNFTFKTEKDRDEKFYELLEGLKDL